MAAGEAFVVTRQGTPVAELRPLKAARRSLVPKAEIAVLAAAGPPLDRRQFQADLARELDEGL